MTTQRKKADGIGGYYWAQGTGTGDSSSDPFVEDVGATISGSITAATEYTEGDVDTTITGGAILWEDTGDTLRTVSAAKPLPVTVATISTITNVVHVDDNSGSLTVDGTVAATQSGTWTVQPGNTANTTAWKVDGSAVTQPVSAASLPLPSGASTSANQTTVITDLGGVTETAPATDTASSGLNGRLQRVAQRLTSVLAVLPAALGGTTAANSLPVTLASDGTYAILSGGVTETAPATDTASSGLNGRLQRIAQRLTSLIALLPTALGQTTMSASLPVTIASNQSALSVTSTVTSITLPTVVYNGKKTVTTAGTRVVLASSQAILSGVTIKALVANTGTIYVGDGSVASTTGYALSPGDTIFLEIANLTTVNLDSSVNGEGVTYIAT